MAVSGLCLFLTLLWVGLWYVIVAYPGHSYLHFAHYILIYLRNKLDIWSVHDFMSRQKSNSLLIFNIVSHVSIFIYLDWFSGYFELY